MVTVSYYYNNNCERFELKACIMNKEEKEKKKSRKFLIHPNCDKNNPTVLKLH